MRLVTGFLDSITGDRTARQWAKGWAIFCALGLITGAPFVFVTSDFTLWQGIVFGLACLGITFLSWFVYTALTVMVLSLIRRAGRD